MDSRNRVINANHESSAPKLFKYSKGDTEEHMNKALLKGALSYSLSNTTSRTTEIESLCYSNEAENPHKLQETPFKNLKMEPEKQKQRDAGLTCKSVRPPPPKKQKLEEAKTRQTLLRPQHSKISNSKELEKEQLEKAPKFLFKARPLNKKILESKGELGLLCNKKRQVTIPQEFHFAIDKRIPPRRTANDVDLFNKVAFFLKSHNKKLIPRNTIPRPFHFQTEERGAQKESKFVVKMLPKQIEGSSNVATKSKSSTFSGRVMKERQRKLQHQT
ncbi:unnamed protein product [Lactuca saligna]|uniref:TPX2 central domain-containing protein n=1 Tax=Lactuca saligna TaxID=75948 RepID=A0AA36DY18_LACSI|nr:unnamed protein product [Lactuca saligna]